MEVRLKYHLIYFMVNPESRRGVYPFFDRNSVDFTKIKEYLYSIARSPNALNIMIPKSYIDEMDVVFMTLSGCRENLILPHFKQILDAAKANNFQDESFHPKTWDPHPGRYSFMKDSAPGIIPVVVNELEKGALMKWCSDLCKAFQIHDIHSLDLYPCSGSRKDPRDTTGIMDVDFNKILEDTFNVRFGNSIVLYRVPIG